MIVIVGGVLGGIVLERELNPRPPADPTTQLLRFIESNFGALDPWQRELIRRWVEDR